MIEKFIEISSQLRVLHWQTESYARHVAYGETYDTVNALIDQFIECYQGRKPRLRVEESISLINVDEDVGKFIDDSVKFLTDDIKEYIDEKDVDLLNIRDEIVGSLYKLRYLLTLK